LLITKVTLGTVALVQGSCRPFTLRQLSSSATEQDYSKYTINLNVFSFSQPTSIAGTNTGSFDGCGGNGAQDATTVEFRNPRTSETWVCVDSVQLV
jgi:hypothetical protein